MTTLVATPLSPAQAQTVRNCEASDPACRAGQIRNSPATRIIRPETRIIRQGENGTVVLPRTGRYRDNGVFGAGQQRPGCDNGVIIQGQGTRAVPNC